MTKKSASKFKLMNGSEAVEDPRGVLEGELKKAKDSIDLMMQIQIDQTDRFDSLLAIHDAYARFGNIAADVSIETAKAIAMDEKQLLTEVRQRIADLTLDEMLEEQGENPLNGFVPGDKIESWEDALRATILFSGIRPWGDKVDQLRVDLVNKAISIGYKKDDEETE